MRRLIIVAALTALAAPAFAQGPAPRPTTAAPATPATASPAEGAPMQTFPSDPAGRSITTRLTPSVESCSWLLRVNGTLTKVDAPDLKLIDVTGPLARPTAPGKLEGVYCERDSMVPGETDHRVPRQLGVPLFINGPTGVATVTIKDQRFQVTFSENSRLTATQQESVRGVVLRWEARTGATEPAA